MDDKTAELRDIFLDATGGEGTVTERQAERRGSLVDIDDPEAVDSRLHDLVATMRGRYDFESDFDTNAYVRLVRRFCEGAADDAIAADLGIDADAVRHARLDCHLIRDADRDHPEFAAIRDRIVDGADDTDDTIADDRGVDAAAVAHVRRVVTADREATRANGRFRDAFTELLTDDDLSGRLVSDSREDGLREATEDIETNVSF